VSTVQVVTAPAQPTVREVTDKLAGTASPVTSPQHTAPAPATSLQIAQPPRSHPVGGIYPRTRVKPHASTSRPDAAPTVRSVRPAPRSALEPAVAPQHTSDTPTIRNSSHPASVVPLAGLGAAPAAGTAAAASGFGGAAIFALLMGLLTIAAIWFSRLWIAPATWRPVAIVSLIERPG
jgi:hypothetical protein